MTEAWRLIPSAPDYEVSDLGRVRGREGRQVWAGPRVGFRAVPEKLLRPGISSNGYPTVVLGRKIGTRTVHSLVAETFIGPCPIGQEVRHKDGDRSNPKLENLIYGTRAQNMEDARQHGTFNPGDPAIIAKAIATRDARDPDWRTKQFVGGDKFANARKAVETKDRLYGRKQWHSSQIAGVAYSKKGGSQCDTL